MVEEAIFSAMSLPSLKISTPPRGTRRHFNPAARVISYYKSGYGQPHVATYGVGFGDFVTRAVAAAQVDDAELDSVSPDDRAFRQELTMSGYAGFPRQFLEAFGADRIRVCFFD